MEHNKNQETILKKLGIKQLNEMQVAAQKAIALKSEIILLSPTGTGKTLAFLLPIIAELNPKSEEVQVLILVPSRELAIQIEQVTREMGSGFKTNAVYGGRSGSKDKMDLKHAPAILIGTPGRIADHMRRETFSTKNIKTLVLDEFDKSLEVGFEKEMMEIVDALPSLKKKVLTSATQKVEIPTFVGLKNPTNLTFSDQTTSQLKLKTVVSTTKDKLDVLADVIAHTGKGSGIVFCNLKDSIRTVSEFLDEKDIEHVCFYGGLEQKDRERALIKFRNKTHRILIATDLAARGIDVLELDFIIHYQLPPKVDEFTHRNGRTARMNSNGTAYILKWQSESLPTFIKGAEVIKIQSALVSNKNKWATLYITGGRKDKISKGDIAGLFFKQGNLNRDELGTIELQQDCSFVAVPSSKARKLIGQLNNTRLKKKKVRISLLE
ncbi:MAG: DEAD/DEAH box helicase [Flavobacteriales bacterium]|nr:DEAD/DEAH box helicase [Flavobacteriales bacterium]